MKDEATMQDEAVANGEFDAVVKAAQETGEERGTEQNGGGLNGGTEAHGEFLGCPLDRGRQ